MWSSSKYKDLIKENRIIIIFIVIILVGIAYALSLQLQIQKQDQILQKTLNKLMLKTSLKSTTLQNMLEQMSKIEQNNSKDFKIQEKRREQSSAKQNLRNWQERKIDKITEKLKQNTEKTTNIQTKVKINTNSNSNNILVKSSLLPSYGNFNKDKDDKKQQNKIEQKNKMTVMPSFQIKNIIQKITNQPEQIDLRLGQKMVQLTKFQQISQIYHGIAVQQSIFARELLELKNQPLTSELSQQQKYYYQQKYNISQYQQLPFCVVIPSYNNAQNNRYLNNINSILQQDYSNFHVVFFDDASDDNTWELMAKFKRQRRVSQQKLKIIRNNQKQLALKNIYKAAHQYCQPYEIFVIVDGDDELIGKQVFKHFNSLFQANDLWLAYSNFIGSATKTAGFSRPFAEGIIQTNSFRKAGFVISHLRAFYTKLFRLIKQEDLKDENGNWFRAANDVAIMYPILQMVHKKHKYSAQLSYLYNSNTKLNNHFTKKQEQIQNCLKIKLKKPYQSLQDLFTYQQKQLLKSKMGQKISLIDNSLSQSLTTEVKYGWQK